MCLAQCRQTQRLLSTCGSPTLVEEATRTAMRGLLSTVNVVNHSRTNRHTCAMYTSVVAAASRDRSARCCYTWSRPCSSNSSYSSFPNSSRCPSGTLGFQPERGLVDSCRGHRSVTVVVAEARTLAYTGKQPCSRVWIVKACVGCVKGVRRTRRFRSFDGLQGWCKVLPCAHFAVLQRRKASCLPPPR